MIYLVYKIGDREKRKINKMFGLFLKAYIRICK